MDIKISPSVISGQLKAPPSKSYSHRAIILASLARGRSKIHNVLFATDIEQTINACRIVGAKIERIDSVLEIEGTDGLSDSTKETVTIQCEDSGTTARLMTAVSTLYKGAVTLDGSERLKKRPMGELFLVLKEQGVKVDNSNGFLPVSIKGAKLKGGNIELDGSKSSQFGSALLLVLPYAEKESEMKIKKLKSKPYINVTLDLMSKFGVKVIEKETNTYHIPLAQYKNTTYAVEGDFSSASYAIALAAVSGTGIQIIGLNPYSKQGDLKILDIVKQMGCKVELISDGIKISGKATNPISIDMSDCPDIVPTVAAIAATIPGKTQITNIAHLKHKESDRIETVKQELEKFGAKVNSTPDSLIITGASLNGAEIDTHNDHRIAMSMVIPAIIAKGESTIHDAQVVEKSYKNFWADIKSIGVNAL